MRLALYTGIILAGGYTCLTPALAADPTGDWRVADGVANIRVAQCSGSMWGAVSWEKQPGGRKSPSGQPHIRSPVMSHFHSSSPRMHKRCCRSDGVRRW